MTTAGRSVLAAASAYAAAGLAVVPVPPDGSKHPRITWRRYRRRRPADRELVTWFAAGRQGVAVLGGRASGGLEVLDFDDDALFAPWRAAVDDHAPGLCAALPVVRTPGPGYHVYLRSPAAAGNRKLAEAPGPKGRPVTLIETRGEGGLVLTPACPPACHPSGRPYTLLQGDLTHIPTISREARALLLDAARALNRYVRPGPAARVVTGAPAPDHAAGTGGRPGEAFNATADWPAILEPHGWTCLRRGADGVTYWRRPGKDGPGWSATADFAASGRLYIFSSNAAPFEPGRAYTRFAAHTLLNFGGDFRAAARALAGRTARAGPDGRVWRRPSANLRLASAVSRRLAPLSKPVGTPLPLSTRPVGAATVTLAAPGRPFGALDAPRMGGRP